MLDGDRLYADVFDNKDPLFFYTYAGALWVGGWRGPFLLDAVWLGVAGVAIALLVRALGAPRSAVVASFFVYPLALAAGWYLVGMSMLAALAFAPLAPWLWLRGRFAGAAPPSLRSCSSSSTWRPWRHCRDRRAARGRGAGSPSSARADTRCPWPGRSARDGGCDPRAARRAPSVSRGDRVQRPLLERAHGRRRDGRSRAGAPLRCVGVLLPRRSLAGAPRCSRSDGVRRSRRSRVGSRDTDGASARRCRGRDTRQCIARCRHDRVLGGAPPAAHPRPLSRLR